ncbi:MAG: hypothetical protein SFZ02_08125 [bacterium]|nr:hypothetical protein [bacterium]
MYRIFLSKLMLLGVIILLSGCGRAPATMCNLMCEWGIDQTNPLTVEVFIDILMQQGWLQNDPTTNLYASYYADTYSSVLETTTIIPLDGAYPQLYESDIKLYIGYVGGIRPEHTGIPFEEIEKIQFNTTIPIWLSWLLFGIPEGGNVSPFYLPNDEDLECANYYNSPPYYHYLAYYNDGKMIIRADFTDSIWLNFLITPVEIVYIFDGLEFYSSWIGRFESVKSMNCPSYR